MNGRQKSEPPIVAVKPGNKAGRPAADPVEPRGGAKENTARPDTHRTQRRASVPQGLDRVRQAAKARRTERFTALLHHVDTDLLRPAVERVIARFGRISRSSGTPPPASTA